MKRKIYLFILAFLLGFATIGCQNAYITADSPTVNYLTLTFYDDMYYDLSTGLQYDDTTDNTNLPFDSDYAGGWSISAKAPVPNVDTFDLDSLDFHYLLFWKNRTFLGYYSVPGNNASHVTGAHLGTIASTTITPPATATHWAIMANKLGEDTPYTLGYSFDDIFSNVDYDPTVSPGFSLSDIFDSSLINYTEFDRDTNLMPFDLPDIPIGYVWGSSNETYYNAQDPSNRTSIVEPNNLDADDYDLGFALQVSDGGLPPNYTYFKVVEDPSGYNVDFDPTTNQVTINGNVGASTRITLSEAIVDELDDILLSIEYIDGYFTQFGTDYYEIPLVQLYNTDTSSWETYPPFVETEYEVEIDYATNELVIYHGFSTTYTDFVLQINVHKYTAYPWFNIDDIIYEGLSLRDIFESEDISATGKNLFDGVLEKGTIYSLTGKETTASNYVRSDNFIKVKSNTNYYYSVNISAIENEIFYYDESYNFISKTASIGLSGGAFTTPNNCIYIKFRNRFTNQTQDEALLQLIMIEQGSTATTYESYLDLDMILTTPSLYGTVDFIHWDTGSLFTTAPSKAQLDEWLEDYLGGGLNYDLYFDLFGWDSTTVDYYYDLYQDSLDMVDRFEFYPFENDATADEFDEYQQEYEDLVALTPILFDTFNDNQGVYSFTEMVIDDVDNIINNFLTDLGLGTFGKFIILIVIVISISILLAIIKVPMIMILLIDLIIFLLSFLLGWIPGWVGILTVILLFVYFIFKIIMNKDGGE